MTRSRKPVDAEAVAQLAPVHSPADFVATLPEFHGPSWSHWPDILNRIKSKDRKFWAVVGRGDAAALQSMRSSPLVDRVLPSHRALRRPRRRRRRAGTIGSVRSLPRSPIPASAGAGEDGCSVTSIEECN